MSLADEDFLADIQRRLELTGAKARTNKFTKADVQKLMNILGHPSRRSERELLRRLRLTERQRDLLLELRNVQEKMEI